jgi:hypothetical protein
MCVTEAILTRRIYRNENKTYFSSNVSAVNLVSVRYSKPSIMHTISKYTYYTINKIYEKNGTKNPVATDTQLLEVIQNTYPFRLVKWASNIIL